jgi:hypothetical protein
MGIQGMAMNAGGVIAGFYQDRNKIFHAIMHDQGVYTTIDPPIQPQRLARRNPPTPVVSTPKQMWSEPISTTTTHGFYAPRGAIE